MDEKLSLNLSLVFDDLMICSVAVTKLGDLSFMGGMLLGGYEKTFRQAGSKSFLTFEFQNYINIPDHILVLDFQTFASVTKYIHIHFWMTKLVSGNTDYSSSFPNNIES